MNYQEGQIINKFVGEDTFDLFTELQRRMRVSKTRFEDFVVKNSLIPFDDGLSFRIDLTEKINADLEVAFRQILQHKKLNADEIAAVLFIFETAIDTIELELSNFEAMVLSGFFKIVTPFVKMFPIRELASELAKYREAIEILNQRLAVAKRELNEAKFDKVIDVAGLALEFVPQLALATKVATSLAGLFADNKLGPGKPDASKYARTSASTFSDQITGTLSKVNKLSSSMAIIGKWGGKVNALYDVFNTDEIDQAKTYVKDVLVALKNQELIHKKINEGIWNTWAAQVYSYQRQLDTMKRNLDASQNEVYEQRRVLEDEIKTSNYRSPKIWRILP